MRHIITNDISAAVMYSSKTDTNPEKRSNRFIRWWVSAQLWWMGCGKIIRKEHEVRIGDERILGDTDFVESVLKQDTLNLNKKTNWHHKGWGLERLSETVCDYNENCAVRIKK